MFVSDFLVLDSWGKWPAGIYAGNMYELGHYDQCVELYHETGAYAGIIQGRYCFMTISLEHLLPLPTERNMPENKSNSWALHLGACIPATCSADRFITLINETVFKNVNVPSIDMICNENEPLIRSFQMVSISFYALAFLLALASTFYEAITISQRRTPNYRLVMFSFIYNGKKLFAINHQDRRKCEKPATISCINGIRVLSMLWIVFSHNYVRIGMQPLINSHQILSWLKSYHSVLVVASTVSVDSFFLMSGLLTCSGILNSLDKHRRLNLPKMYLHRYLRLTPALAVVVLFTASLMKFVGSGPFWGSAMTLMSDNCHKYWWSTLLYIQNYVNPREMCLGHSWYLAVDMQLYIISPLIIYPLWKWGRKLLIPIITLIFASMATVYIMFHLHKFRLSILDVDEERNRHVHTYYPTHTRAGAWLVGIVYGYILQRTKNHFVIIPYWSVVLGWTLAGCGMLSILLADYPIQQPNYKSIPQAFDAIYESSSRVAWACGIGWIIFACVNGYGGLANQILSFSIWQPLGRLSYCIYLLHLPIQLMMAGAQRIPYYFTDLLAVYQFWGDIGFTITIAVVWVLIFESPVICLEKTIFGVKANK